MARKKKFKAKKSNSNALQKHNDLGYLDDLQHICKLGLINESRRDWIETTMLKLRDSANIYEHKFGGYLIKCKIDFIHQAPFIFNGKIYFADFYLPKYHTIVEIDGIYHSGLAQGEYDRFRDECFNGHKLKVLRIPNGAVLKEKDIKILLNDFLSKKNKK